MPKKHQTQTIKPEPAIQSLETFRHFGPWDISQLKQAEPSCFNGVVLVERYRVTIEKIAEPIEVIHERIQKMFDATTNHHRRQSLREAAARYGMILKS